ncbi:MAG: RHS repeat-associated core domain-containing protein, partial [Akkermansiaceae bacterium]
HHHEKSVLVLTWFRAYDAERGRWLSADPIGEAGGMNLYAYCYGNPLDLYDPNGMWPEWAPGSDSYSWGEYFGDVGDVYAGEAKGAAEHLSFGLYKPCYENDMQGA